MNLERYGRLRAQELEHRRMLCAGRGDIYVPRRLTEFHVRALFGFLVFAFACALAACGLISVFETALRYVAGFFGVRV